MSYQALQIASTGMAVSMEKINVIANNVANINTIGFKKYFLESTDLQYSSKRSPGLQESADSSPRPVGIEIGSGARVSGVYRILSAGEVMHTGNPMNVAIIGRGYFQVQLPNGRVAYTRSGSLHLDRDRRLTTVEGYPIIDAPEIPEEIDLNTLEITAEGIISAKVPGQENIDIGRLTLYTFPNEAGLEALGNGFLAQTEGSGEAVGTQDLGQNGVGYLRQSHLEASNVNPVAEITDLISAQRAYELNTKIMKAVDDMLQSSNQIK